MSDYTMYDYHPNHTNSQNRMGVNAVPRNDWCDPHTEDCSHVEQFTKSQRDVDLTATILFMFMDTVYAVAPFLVHFLWSHCHANAHLPVRITSWVAMITNGALYGTGLLWSIFAFFPEAFGTKHIGYYLDYSYWGVLVAGGLSQLVIILSMFGAAAIYQDQGIWIYFIAYAGTSIAFYVVYAAMMTNFQEFWVRLVYHTLEEQEQEEMEESETANEEGMTMDF